MRFARGGPARSTWNRCSNTTRIPLSKSVDQVLALLQVLNCDVDLVVRTKTA
jgi:hypothetical protein